MASSVPSLSASPCSSKRTRTHASARVSAARLDSIRLDSIRPGSARLWIVERCHDRGQNNTQIMGHFGSSFVEPQIACTRLGTCACRAAGERVGNSVTGRSLMARLGKSAADIGSDGSRPCGRRSRHVRQCVVFAVGKRSVSVAFLSPAMARCQRSFLRAAIVAD